MLENHETSSIIGSSSAPYINSLAQQYGLATNYYGIRHPSLAVLGLTLLQGWQRRLAMIPTFCLAAFVWENRLVVEPSITRLILIGVILIVLMNARPQGLLGSARVEIV